MPGRGKSILVLFCLTAVCASVNLTKAFHIDDTVQLETAKAILANPLHPLSGTINWDKTARPILARNHPILFAYLVASVMAICGPSEVALHILTVVATTLVIVLFHALARVLVPRSALPIAALFVLGPVFLPAQNLMLDVPLLAVWLLFFWSILTASRDRATGRYALGALTMGLACLIKYASVVLPPIFLLVIVYRRHWRHLAWLAVPVGTLAGWSLFSYFDSGAVHLFRREVRGMTWGNNPLVRSVEWIGGLGAVAPFTVILLTKAGRRHVGSRTLAASLFAGFATCLTSLMISYRDPDVFSLPTTGLWAVFVANGVLTLGLVYGGLREGGLVGMRTDQGLRSKTNTILVLWIAGASLFFVLFMHAVTTRYILLAFPAILLLVGRSLPDLPESRQYVPAVVVTGVLGGWLAVSDYVWADVYRRHAPRIAGELGPDGTVWYTGHWGWQWYADRAGMHQYDPARTALEPGDHLVIPSLPHPYEISARHLKSLKKVSEYAVPSGPATWLRTMSADPWGGYYLFSLRNNAPPYRFSLAPLERFSIYRVLHSPAARSE